MKTYVRLCCLLKKEEVITKIEELLSHRYYPTEDLFAICQENQQNEACALLSSKLGRYFESVTQFLNVLKEYLSIKHLKFEIYIAKN